MPDGMHHRRQHKPQVRLTIIVSLLLGCTPGATASGRLKTDEAEHCESVDYLTWARSVTALQAMAAMHYQGADFAEVARRQGQKETSLRVRLRRPYPQRLLADSELKALERGWPTDTLRPFEGLFDAIAPNTLPDYLSNDEGFATFLSWVQSAIDNPEILSEARQGHLKAFTNAQIARAVGMKNKEDLTALLSRSAKKRPTQKRFIKHPKIYELFHLKRALPEGPSSRRLRANYSLDDVDQALRFWSVLMSEEEQAEAGARPERDRLASRHFTQLLGYTAENMPKQPLRASPPLEAAPRFAVFDRLRASVLYRLRPACPQRAQEGKSEPASTPMDTQHYADMAGFVRNARVTVLRGRNAFVKAHPELRDAPCPTGDWVVDHFLDAEFFDSFAKADDTRLPKHLDSLDWLDRKHPVYQRCFSDFLWHPGFVEISRRLR